MKMIVVALRDILTDTRGRPFVSQNKAAAIRDLMLQVNDRQNGGHLYENPAHFEAYLIGHYDDATGIITPCEHERISHLNQLKKPKNEHEERADALRSELETANTKSAQLQTRLIAANQALEQTREELANATDRLNQNGMN